MNIVVKSPIGDSVGVTYAQWAWTARWKGSGRIELRIGEAKRGTTRFALLSKHEARRVAHALLDAAVQAEEAEEKHEQWRVAQAAKAAAS